MNHDILEHGVKWSEEAKQRVRAARKAGRSVRDMFANFYNNQGKKAIASTGKFLRKAASSTGKFVDRNITGSSARKSMMASKNAYHKSGTGLAKQLEKTHKTNAFTGVDDKTIRKVNKFSGNMSKSAKAFNKSSKVYNKSLAGRISKAIGSTSNKLDKNSVSGKTRRVSANHTVAQVYSAKDLRKGVKRLNDIENKSVQGRARAVGSAVAKGAKRVEKQINKTGSVKARVSLAASKAAVKGVKAAPGAAQKVAKSVAKAKNNIQRDAARAVENGIKTGVKAVTNKKNQRAAARVVKNGFKELGQATGKAVDNLSEYGKKRVRKMNKGNTYGKRRKQQGPKQGGTIRGPLR